MIKTALVNPRTGKKARITDYGELVVGRYDYSVLKFNAMSGTATAYNFFAPKMNARFVITDILIDADRNVSNTVPATIDVYEASGAASTTIEAQILKVELLRNTNRDLTGLNIITSGGVWINAKTDDATVNVTLAGYYVSEDDAVLRRGV